MTTVAERLKAVRNALGVTQVEIAELVGVSANTWRRCEQNNEPPNSTVLLQLAKEGVDATWLLTGEGEMMRQMPTADAAGEIARLLDAIEDELHRQKVPVIVEHLEEASPLKYRYRQLVEIAANPAIADDLRARADMILDLGFASAEAMERRERRGWRGTEEFQRDLRSVTDIYTRILRDLDWQPPALTGMAVRDAMIIDRLSEETARYILSSLKHDLLAGDV